MGHDVKILLLTLYCVLSMPHRYLTGREISRRKERRGCGWYSHDFHVMFISTALSVKHPRSGRSDDDDTQSILHMLSSPAL
jgi:hypothetical protein